MKRGELLRQRVTEAERALAAAQREERRHPTDLRRELHEAEWNLRDARTDLDVYETLRPSDKVTAHT